MGVGVGVDVGGRVGECVCGTMCLCVVLKCGN